VHRLSVGVVYWQGALNNVSEFVPKIVFRLISSNLQRISATEDDGSVTHPEVFRTGSILALRTADDADEDGIFLPCFRGPRESTMLREFDSDSQLHCGTILPGCRMACNFGNS
jgi:hypothetical protein